VNLLLPPRAVSCRTEPEWNEAELRRSRSIPTLQILRRIGNSVALEVSSEPGWLEGDLERRLDVDWHAILCCGIELPLRDGVAGEVI